MFIEAARGAPTLAIPLSKKGATKVGVDRNFDVPKKRRVPVERGRALLI